MANVFEQGKVLIDGSLKNDSIEAGVAKYKAVQNDNGNIKVAEAGDIGDPVFGVLVRPAGYKEQARVCRLGLAPVEAGGEIAEGATLRLGVDGRVVSTGAGYVIGRAETSASASGDIISAFINVFQTQPAT